MNSPNVLFRLVIHPCPKTAASMPFLRVPAVSSLKHVHGQINAGNIATCRYENSREDKHCGTLLDSGMKLKKHYAMKQERKYRHPSDYNIRYYAMLHLAGRPQGPPLSSPSLFFGTISFFFTAGSSLATLVGCSGVPCSQSKFTLATVS